MEDRSQGNRRLVMVAAKCLALVWAGWWMFFSVAVGLIEKNGLIESYHNGLWIGPLSLAIALIALRWETVGGILLVLSGVAGAIPNLLYGVSTESMLLSPAPLIAGIMLLASIRKPEENTR